MSRIKILRVLKTAWLIPLILVKQHEDGEMAFGFGKKRRKLVSMQQWLLRKYG